MTATNITTRSRSRSIRSELESESEQFALPEENTPHFFKFIHPLILQVGRLRIPQKFIGKYGKDLLEHVYLKVPNGKLWKVELKNSNGEAWLQNGWKEFAGHYSVDLCYILAFRYEGNLHFLVLIFDMSALEIEYPPPPTTAQNERTNSPVNFKDGGDSESMHPAKRKRVLSVAEKERPPQSARSFTSKKPFFIVTLRPSYVNSNSGVNIQQVFADRYLRKKSENGNFTFKVGDGMRVWSVKWTLFTNCAKLSTGWGAFVRDNYLQVDDVCVFELINADKNLFNVVIFRAAEAV
ncbi:hypothetical protein LguiA_017413 [Lonicera macranthoides]